MRFILLLLCLTSLSLSAQQKAEYRLSNSFGLSGLLSADALNQGAFASFGLDRLRPISEKNTFFLGLSLQYANHENGNLGQPCDFPLGDKVVLFSSSETYEFNSLEAGLRLGAEHRFGRFNVRGILLPTLRLHDRITTTSAINFDGFGRPDQFIVEKVRANEEFTWTDGTQRELRFNSPVQLQTALEADFSLNKRLSLGLGYQVGLTPYELTNYAVATESCGVAGCTPIPEYETSSVDARAGRGYVTLRVKL